MTDRGRSSNNSEPGRQKMRSSTEALPTTPHITKGSRKHTLGTAGACQRLPLHPLFSMLRHMHTHTHTNSENRAPHLNESYHRTEHSRIMGVW